MRRPSLALALLAAVLPAAARAEAPPPMPPQSPAEVVRLEVLPGWRAGDGRHVAGLRLTLAPGWKTYWRAPGAAGLAPAFDFGGSDGVASAEVGWPVPEVFHQAGLRSVGYHGQVTLPVELALAPGTGEARLAGAVEVGVCREVCVPVRLPFAASLPVHGDRDPAIVAALVDRPMTAEEAGARATCTVAPRGDGLALAVRVAMPPIGPAEAVVIEAADPALWVSEAAAAREGGTLVATAEVLAPGGGPVALDRSSLRITVLGDGAAVDIRGCAAG